MKSNLSVIALLLGACSVEALFLQKQTMAKDVPRSNTEESQQNRAEELALAAFEGVSEPIASLSKVNTTSSVPAELQGTAVDPNFHQTLAAAKSDDDEEHEKKEKKEKAQKEAKAKAAAINWKDPAAPSVVEFYKEYDHVGYDRGQIANDMGRIKVERTKKEEANHFCARDDWTTVHYKTYNEDQLIQDSRTFEQGKPKVFRLGHYEVSKCWDISIQQIRQGETATVTCPGELANGG